VAHDNSGVNEQSDASRSEEDEKGKSRPSGNHHRATRSKKKRIRVIKKTSPPPSVVRLRIGPRMFRHLSHTIDTLLRTYAEEIWLALPINPRYLEKELAMQACGHLAQGEGDRVLQFCVVSALFSGSYP
jgi:hypothetical protein